MESIRVPKIIAVYADDLGVYTSSTPSRDILRQLIAIRPQDQFLLVFRKGSESEPWVEPYYLSLPRQNIEIKCLRWSRRHANIRTLIGFSPFENDIPHADLYLRFNVGGMGKCGFPIIDSIADLSSLDKKTSSMPWHGRLLFKRGLRHTLNSSDRTVAISRSTADAVFRYFAISPTKLEVIHLGIAEEWFRVAAESQPGIQNYWMWYGQITPRKNLDRLLVAYCSLSRENPELNIPRLRFIAKRNPFREDLEEKARSLGIHQSIDFVDPLGLSDLIECVRRCKAVVFPSLYEGFGMPIVEAMACGRPVLTSSTTSMPEVAGGHALLCDPNEIGSIRDGLFRLLDSGIDAPEKQIDRQKHASVFTVARAATRYSNLIDEILINQDNANGKRPNP